MNLEEIKQKIFNKLEPSGWGRIFKSFIFSSDFDNILLSLWKLSESNKRFTPPLKQIFRVFEECPYDKLKVIMLFQEPYLQLHVASGIALSCDNTYRFQSALTAVLNEVNNTVYNNEAFSISPDLTKWSNQGILMLNASLTTEINKSGSHYNIWKPFIAYLLDWLNNYNPGLIYVYMGEKVTEWSDLTNINNYKFFLKNPTDPYYINNKWDCMDVFNKISLIIQENNNEKIIW